jgi:hypothetical protein
MLTPAKCCLPAFAEMLADPATLASDPAAAGWTKFRKRIRAAEK